MADDGCELVTLEGYASAVFRRHYQHEAWICPASDVKSLLEENRECLQVMHRGNIVWACSVDPIKTSPPESWVGPTTWKQNEVKPPEETTTDEVDAANDDLVEKIKAALPKITLPSLFRRGMWTLTK